MEYFNYPTIRILTHFLHSRTMTNGELNIISYMIIASLNRRTSHCHLGHCMEQNQDLPGRIYGLFQNVAVIHTLRTLHFWSQHSSKRKKSLKQGLLIYIQVFSFELYILQLTNGNASCNLIVLTEQLAKYASSNYHD